MKVSHGDMGDTAMLLFSIHAETMQERVGGFSNTSDEAVRMERKGFGDEEDIRHVFLLQKCPYSHEINSVHHSTPFLKKEIVRSMNFDMNLHPSPLWCPDEKKRKCVPEGDRFLYTFLKVFVRSIRQ